MNNVCRFHRKPATSFQDIVIGLGVGQGELLTGWWRQTISRGSPKSFGIILSGIMNIQTKCHGNVVNSC